MVAEGQRRQFLVAFLIITGKYRRCYCGGKSRRMSSPAGRGERRVSFIVVACFVARERLWVWLTLKLKRFVIQNWS